ncbi:hypothetical protein BCR35DRAFT_354987 [Leucosporidium creatinivorum]|uniref:Uncharacterized protein n=1 Tax=Leucosporidium creatinivorum TaxID=106004 RepID=A0A1Y2DZD0_9BASI|nr:hypothetical protein BCR35DRAFT_354987 [Leucosporidium creatinivorum]
MLATRTLVRKLKGSLKQLKNKLKGKGRKEKKAVEVQSAPIVAQEPKKFTTTITASLEIDSALPTPSITLNTLESTTAPAEQQTASPQPANELKEALTQLYKDTLPIIEEEEVEEEVVSLTELKEDPSTSSSLDAEDASSLALSDSADEATSISATTTNSANADSSAISHLPTTSHPTTEVCSSSSASPARSAPSTEPSAPSTEPSAPSTELTVADRIAKGNAILQRIRESLARQKEEAERKQREEEESMNAEESAQQSAEEEKETSNDLDESLISSDEEEDFVDSISPTPSPPSSPEPSSPSAFCPADTCYFPDSSNVTCRRRRTPTQATLSPALLALRAEFGRSLEPTIVEEEQEEDSTLDPRFIDFSSLRKPRPAFRPAPRTLEKDDDDLRRQAITERLRLKIAAERERQERGPVDEEESEDEGEQDYEEEEHPVSERPVSRMSFYDEDDEDDE